MLRLYVMRHAKSSWAVPGARDFDRELNQRGLSDLDLIGKAIKDKSYTPEMVICSNAVRTQKTLAGILPAFVNTPDITYSETLYSGSTDDYLQFIRQTENATSLMLVGHNPMCGSLAYSLIGEGAPERMDRISYKYPTGTLCVLDFDVSSWQQINLRQGKLVDCLIPSELRS